MRVSFIRANRTGMQCANHQNKLEIVTERSPVSPSDWLSSDEAYFYHNNFLTAAIRKLGYEFVLLSRSMTFPSHSAEKMCAKGSFVR